mmetsp:Transcript_38859/g.76398  ORF Transcript_38859/g.76398 Transcript_38859/m.76398 type:complete len:426 (-) Transcript_38859:95-1372(-)
MPAKRANAEAAAAAAGSEKRPRMGPLDSEEGDAEMEDADVQQKEEYDGPTCDGLDMNEDSDPDLSDFDVDNANAGQVRERRKRAANVMYQKQKKAAGIDEDAGPAEEADPEEKEDERGQAIEPFNMREEMATGDFDEFGNYVPKKKPEEGMRDAWLDSVDQEAGDSKFKDDDERAKVQKLKEKAEAEQKVVEVDVTAFLSELCGILATDDETPMVALRRLKEGGSKKPVFQIRKQKKKDKEKEEGKKMSEEDQKAFDRLTELCDGLMSKGSNAYFMSKRQIEESLQRRTAGGGAAAPSGGAAAAAAAAASQHPSMEELEDPTRSFRIGEGTQQFRYVPDVTRVFVSIDHVIRWLSSSESSPQNPQARYLRAPIVRVLKALFWREGGGFHDRPFPLSTSGGSASGPAIVRLSEQQRQLIRAFESAS